MLRKYLPVIQNTWAEYTVYRLNFVLWRVRNVLKLLTIYFLWSAIFSSRREIFGYNHQQILTYILLSQILSATVFSTRTQEVGVEINQGKLANFLLKPMSYFSYWWARDLSDKLVNIIFAVFEIALLILLLKPPLFFQADLLKLFFFIIAVVGSAVLYFYISFLLSLSGFWTADIWAPRFVFFIVTDFFSGGLFPLDILPKNIYHLLTFLPFTYLQFFPLKIYLGQLAAKEIATGFLMTAAWLLLIYFFVQIVWHRGLRRFEAHGR